MQFPISEQEYLKLRDFFLAKDSPLQSSLELILSDGSVYPMKGKIDIVGRGVESSTGTMRIRAIFPNPGNVLRPGEYSRIRAATSIQKDALLVPQRAVQELQGEYELALVDSANKIAFRTVKVGDRVGSYWVIEQGLKPTDRVVIEGLQDIKTGQTVDPKPAKMPPLNAGAPQQSQSSRLMSKFFINRPVTAIVISILIVIAGIIMVQRLPIAQFPSIAPPEIVVTTNYVGADALTIERAVATPIEEAMAGVEGMLYMRSFNANDGTMKLRIDFDLDLDPNIAEVFSEIRVNRALPQLPPSVRDQGVTIAKSHVSPLMIIALSSPKGTRDAKFLANYAYINISDPLTRVRGIGSVVVQGAGAYAMRQWVKPDQLASLGVTVPDMVKALEQQNTVNPSGQVGAEPAPPGQEFTYTMRSQGRLVTEEDFCERGHSREPGWLDRAHERRGADRTGNADLQRNRAA